MSHTLYGFPFACSLAVHASLRQHEVPFEMHWVQRGFGRRVQTGPYDAINPKRKVPTLELPTGERLTEIVSVLTYLDDTHGPSRDATGRRTRLEWLSFLATELHQAGLGPIFDPGTPEPAIEDVLTRILPSTLAYLEHALDGRQTVLGGEPDVVDSYLTWGLTLLRFRHAELVSTPALTAYRRSMVALPHIAAALRHEQQAMQTT